MDKPIRDASAETWESGNLGKNTFLRGSETFGIPWLVIRRRLLVSVIKVRGKMFQTDPGKDRSQLGFADAVRSSFTFLRAYGLIPVEENATFVRYESDAVFINVYHWLGSFEVGVEIGRLDPPEK
jgi:hypothetical protein